MSISALVPLGLAAVALLFLIRWGCRRRLVELDKGWLPVELRDARLVYTERVFRASSPVPIVVRLDRGYRNAEGVIILVELKTRRLNRPYLSDVIELSAQRVAVQAQTGEHVANYGYVVITSGDNHRKMVHRVAVLSTREVVALIWRRSAVVAGKAVPRYADSKGLCTRCAFKRECDSAQP